MSNGTGKPVSESLIPTIVVCSAGGAIFTESLLSHELPLYTTTLYAVLLVEGADVSYLDGWTNAMIPEFNS
jgi:hypothetical protein